MLTKNRKILAFFSSLLVALAVLILSNCKRSPDPAPATNPTAPLAVFIGGLDNDQTGSVRAMVADDFPSFQRMVFGPKNGWKSDVAGVVKKAQFSKLVMVAHSFGTDRACRDAAKLGVPIRLLVLLDPVAFDTGNEEVWVPANVERCLVFRASKQTPFVNQARVHGVFEETIVEGHHSEICHDPAMLDAVREAMSSAFPRSP